MKILQRVSLVGLVVCVAGCASMSMVKGLFVSGVSIEAVGHQFAQVSEQVTTGCEKGAIPPQTCDKYRAFGLHFKRTYPLTVGMWNAARKGNDVASQEKAEEVIQVLAVDLSKLAVEALGSFLPEAQR